jgi:dihydropyrimidinase
MAADPLAVLVKGGLLVSGNAISRQDVLIDQGKVVRVADGLSPEGVRAIVDARGKYVLPGGIDSHAHPIFADKMDTYSICAAYGGVTTVIAFIGSETHRHKELGNTWGIREYNPDIVKGFIEYGQHVSYTDFAIHGLITMRDRDDLRQVVPELIRLGVISFKMFMTWNPWMSGVQSNLLGVPDEVIVEVMNLSSQHGALPMVHAENGCCKAFLESEYRAKGLVSRHHWLPSAPNILESEAVNRAATMAFVTKSPLYPVHLSTREVIPILEHYKGLGLSLYGETCPHYLALTNDDLISRGHDLKVAPPLREDQDRQAMWDGIGDGAIQVIGSDFTGYTRKLKLGARAGMSPMELADSEENIFDVASGLTTLEFMMPVVWTLGVNTGRITLPRFVELFAENPAKIFGLYPRKGTLQVGSDADLVVWDPAKRHVVDEEHGLSDLGTFRGMELLGMPVLTMVRGQIVVKDGKLSGKSGNALFIPGDPDVASYAKNGFHVK